MDEAPRLLHCKELPGQAKEQPHGDETLEFSQNVTILEQEQKTYYLVGTAHISKHSVQEVKDVIDAVQPDTVCVELCETRYKALTDENVWKKLDIFQVIKQGKTLYLLAHLALSMYQRRMGEQFGVKPGAELMAAIEKADEIGADLVLIDRDVQITLKRTWGNLSFVQKFTMLGSLMWSMFDKQELTEEALEELKEQEQLSDMLDALAKEFPQIKSSLIDERDLYMVSSLQAAPGEKIVAVVGAGHVKGMKAHFEDDIDKEPLNELPPPGRTGRILKWVIPTIVLALFYIGFHKNVQEQQNIYLKDGSVLTGTILQAETKAKVVALRTKKGTVRIQRARIQRIGKPFRTRQSFKQMLTAWILPNSIMCALLALLAGAKLITIVVAFIASPITSLNPAIGAGMVTGLVEAWLRKPTVEDCERINEDVTSLSGIYKNAFTRVLLVAVLSNFGSALGAWIGLSWLFTLLT